MNNCEFASYLELNGYSIHEETGFNFECFLLGLNPKNINYDKLNQAAIKEDYVLTNLGWIEKGLSHLDTT